MFRVQERQYWIGSVTLGVLLLAGMARPARAATLCVNTGGTGGC